MSCINLHERFGDRYRVTVDQESTEGPRDRDPWIFQIRCRRGLIYPFGSEQLAVQVDGHRGIARRLAALPGLSLIQDGSNERTFSFPVRLFGRVAALVKPYRRRRLSDADRQRRADRMRSLNANKNATCAG